MPVGIYPRKSAIERFWPKVHKTETCWNWIACIGGAGYGQFYSGERLVGAHRWSYEHFVGPIPFGLTIDHLCRNRPCVNPQHLEPVTKRENNLRGVGSPAKNAAKIHCKRGHEFVQKVGYRLCLTCSNRRSREYRKQRRVLAESQAMITNLGRKPND